MDLPDPDRIIVVQIGKIGDMILTTPLFSELKRIFPYAKLTVLSSSINKDIPLNNENIDEVIVYKKSLLSNLLFNKTSLKGADIWIDTKESYSKTSELLVKLYKPKHSIGFNYNKKVFDTTLNDYVRGKHAIDINLSVVNYFEKGSHDNKVSPSFNIPVVIKSKSSLQLENSSQMRILLNVSAGNQSRYIGADIWINIIKKINSSMLSSFILIGLKKDSKLINSILKEARGVDVKYIKTKNILETSEVIRNSYLVISPDTSVIHICSVFNKPVIGLYPDVNWNLEKFAPLSDLNEVIISKNENSLEGIHAEKVFEGYLRLNKKITSGNAESRTRVRKEDH